MRPEFDRASPRAQASRLRPLALEALRQHGIESSRVRLLQHGENTTFRADGERRFVVRVHRFGYRTLAEIESELIFLLGLAEASEVVAPQPHFTPSGAGAIELDAPGLDGPRVVTVLGWADGRHQFRPGLRTFREMGRLTAELHLFARAWTPPPRFLRPSYAIDAQMCAEPTVHSLEQVPRIQADRRAALIRSRDEIVAEFTPFELAEGGAIPIHADLHFGNVVQQGTQLNPIDFDDLAVGHPVGDAAVSVGLSVRERREAYFEGYRSVAAFPQPWVDALPAYSFGRRIRMLGWNSYRATAMPHLGNRIPMLVELALMVDKWRRSRDEAVVGEIRHFLERSSS